MVGIFLEEGNDRLMAFSGVGIHARVCCAHLLEKLAFFCVAGVFVVTCYSTLALSLHSLRTLLLFCNVFCRLN
jgi:hypothetical protein